MGDIRLGRRSNALVKHSANAHPGNAGNYRSKPLIGGTKFNLDRFIMEGHQIQKYSQDPTINILNSRMEWATEGCLGFRFIRIDVKLVKVFTPQQYSDLKK